MIRHASARGCKMLATPPDPCALRPAGGVAVVASGRARAAELSPITEEFAQLRGAGRVLACVLDLGIATPVA
eukprot:10353554-Alexandrium_andersonii.AAC.1